MGIGTGNRVGKRKRRRSSVIIVDSPEVGNKVSGVVVWF